MIAHIAGVPVEETLLPLLGGLGTGLLLARSWITSRVRRSRHDVEAVRPATERGRPDPTAVADR